MNYYYRYYNFEQLNINETKYMNLIYNIQKNYNDNPYHNSIHAADVSNTVFYMLETLNIGKTCGFTKQEKLILLLSTAAHDVDHPGNTNMFEINSRSALALTYNDKSVLENYHLFLFFNFISDDSMNVFDKYDLNQMKDIRKQVIANILSTDMLNHKADLTKLQGMVKTTDFNPEKEENKSFIMTQLLHFSDISNSTKPFNIFQKWVDRLFVEFYTQVYIYINHKGDNEREMGFPISMLCDREKTVIPDSQIFFINFFVVDLVKTLSIPFPKVKKFEEALEENKKQWEEKKGKPYVIKDYK